ncbi:MAG TPA: protein kinase [Candidatus Angelobacter sp.]|jgi:serine/threonine-protein kinase|nr:protein kinase [Candidatus Angelobacter sp.]
MSLQKVGRYEIVEELGRGAMGLVYKALDPTIGRTVALKTMRLDVHGLETEDMLRRFRNEARAAGLLNHPNVVTIYDAGEQDGIFYIAMEYIEGTTLHAVLLEKRVLAPEEVIELSRHMCKGLDYAHSHGIIHRDIKPANIMITNNGTVKIMDFGIAKAGGGMTNTGQVLGTPNYMSPEQVKGKPLDGRSDLFSFGVILYEMITGEKPFVGQNVTTIIYKIVNESPISPRDLDVTVHPGLSAVVTKTLAKSPDDRYQTGAALMNDLERYKSLGSNLAATAVMAPGTIAVQPVHSESEQTLVLPGTTATAVAEMPPTLRVSSGTAAAVSPAKISETRTAERPGTTVIETHKVRLFIGLGVAVLLAALGIAGYGIYERHAAQKLADHADAQKKLDETIKASTPQVTVPPPVPDPTPELESQSGQSAADKTNGKPPHVKSNVSPNKVFSHQAELKINSNPDGAKVEVDGYSEPKWITPFTASNLAPGKHNVVLTKPGYLEEERDVEVAAGKSLAVDVSLNPVSPKVVVSSTPSGANIWIDGKDTGKTTPSEIINLEKGAHTIVLRKQGFKEVSTSETLTDGQTLTYSPVLLANATIAQKQDAQKQDAQKQDEGQGRPGFWKRVFGGKNIPEGKGLIHVRTNPQGALIVHNGRVAPDKTDALWPVDPGTYDIELRKDGYKTVHRTVRVEKGKITDVDELLEKLK